MELGASLTCLAKPRAPGPWGPFRVYFIFCHQLPSRTISSSHSPRGLTSSFCKRIPLYDRSTEVSAFPRMKTFWTRDVKSLTTKLFTTTGELFKKFVTFFTGKVMCCSLWERRKTRLSGPPAQRHHPLQDSILTATPREGHGSVHTMPHRVVSRTVPLCLGDSNKGGKGCQSKGRPGGSGRGCEDPPGVVGGRAWL